MTDHIRELWRRYYIYSPAMLFMLAAAIIRDYNLIISAVVYLSGLYLGKATAKAEASRLMTRVLESVEKFYEFNSHVGDIIKTATGIDVNNMSVEEVKAKIAELEELFKKEQNAKQ